MSQPTPTSLCGRVLPPLGMTLPELILVLAIAGVLLATVPPRLFGGPDRWITAQAREEVVAILYQARLEARRHGGAVVEARTGEGLVVHVEAGEVARWVPADPRTHFELAGTRDRAELSFGPAGTGRFANATFRVRRGSVTREVVLSSYGRVRR